MGPELGGDPRREFAKRSKDANFREHRERTSTASSRTTFMMYLPRLCEHCLNPTCVASCAARSTSARRTASSSRPGQVPRLADVASPAAVQEDLLQWSTARPRSASSATRGSSGPADRVLEPVWPHPLPRVLSTTPTGSRPRRRSRTRRRCTKRSSACSSTRATGGDRAGAARRRAGSLVKAATESPVSKNGDGLEGRAAAAPEYRRCRWSGTCRPLSPIRPPPTAGQIGRLRRAARRALAAHPAQYLANLLTAGDEARWDGAGADAGDARLHARPPRRAAREAGAGAGGLSVLQVEEMYRYMATPTTRTASSSRRRTASTPRTLRRARRLRLPFGNGCSEGQSDGASSAAREKTTRSREVTGAGA